MAMSMDVAFREPTSHLDLARSFGFRPVPATRDEIRNARAELSGPRCSRRRPKPHACPACSRVVRWEVELCQDCAAVARGTRGRRRVGVGG